MFDGVLDSSLSNQQAYEQSVAPMLANSLNQKEDLFLFGFGNTNSGKTYSIFGEDNQLGFFGLTYLTLIHKHTDKIEQIQLQAFEIYNEKIYDLLRDPSIKEPIQMPKTIYNTDQVMSMIKTL